MTSDGSGDALAEAETARSGARRRRILWAVPVCVLLGLTSWWLSDFMPSSTESLEDRTSDQPGVIRVVATEADGNDGLPFPLERERKSVTVTMEGDSTAREINHVLHSYDDDIDDGDLGGVYLVLDGSKRAALSLGEDIHASPPVVDELVDALQDPEILGYHREAYPVLPSVHVRITPGRFDRVVRFADQFGEVEPIELVTVVSGGFGLERDERFVADSTSRAEIGKVTVRTR